jgi:hypothetical protein
MAGQILPMPSHQSGLRLETIPVQEELTEKPGMSRSAARGAITGIVLGAALWTGLIAGFVAYFKH